MVQGKLVMVQFVFTSRHCFVESSSPTKRVRDGYGRSFGSWQWQKLNKYHLAKESLDHPTVIGDHGSQGPPGSHLRRVIEVSELESQFKPKGIL